MENFMLIFSFASISNEMFFFFFTVIIVLIITFILLGYLFSANRIKNIVAKSQKIEDKFVTKKEFFKHRFNDDVRIYKDKLQNLERIIGVLQGKLIDLENKVSTQNESIVVSNNDTENSKEIFFKTKNGKMLQEELPSQADSFFKVFDINNNKAKFSYCGGVVNSDFFDGVCRFKNNPVEVKNITKIETDTPGIVNKDSSGNWVVETPATIKFL